MNPWKLTDSAEYLKQNPHAHAILGDVPLHDVWCLDLPGGGDGRTVSDIRALAAQSRPSGLARLLFSIRWKLGRVFGWDQKKESGDVMFASRITQEDRDHSSVASGTTDGPFTVLYVHPMEAISEIRNATVHAALVTLLKRQGTGYRLLWAIYVEPVGKLTGFYMRLIEPFRRWIVYPSLLRNLHRAWSNTYASAV